LPQDTVLLAEPGDARGGHRQAALDRQPRPSRARRACVIAKRYQRTGNALRCSYAISPGYWVPRKNPKVSAALSTGGQEEYTTLKEEPPVGPPLDAGGAAPVVPNSEGQEGEAAAPASDPEIIRPGEAGTRPYRNRQPRPAKVWINGRWRRPPREARTGRPSPHEIQAQGFRNAVAARAALRQAGPESVKLLPPQAEILPPEAQSLRARRPIRNGPNTKLALGFYLAIQERKRQREELPR
jgi:hypothetical protein